MIKMHYTIEDKIALITLDDGKMNVMNWEFLQELNDCLDRTLADRASVLIFTGRQGIFSAGLDLKLLPTLSTIDEQLTFQKTFASAMLRVYMLPVPTIAAYTGHSIAGGAILSYACDRFVLGDGPYKIQINEVANKMILTSWISLICRSSIPHQFWKEAMLHARAYSPREAFERGIVDDLVDGENKVMETAKELARDLFRLHGPAYAFTKKLMRQEEANKALNYLEKELREWAK
ncbi:MAG TPA: hypothetical protein ENN23_01775 [Deltaproteobacteria bacterium]|nr:hypothetical protein [Deltaproteobacteria bacterium]